MHKCTLKSHKRNVAQVSLRIHLILTPQCILDFLQAIYIQWSYSGSRRDGNETKMPHKSREYAVTQIVSSYTRHCEHHLNMLSTSSEHALDLIVVQRVPGPSDLAAFPPVPSDRCHASARLDLLPVYHLLSSCCTSSLERTTPQLLRLQSKEVRPLGNLGHRKKKNGEPSTAIEGGETASRSCSFYGPDYPAASPPSIASVIIGVSFFPVVCNCS